MNEQSKENEFAGCSAAGEEFGRSSRAKRKQMEPFYCPVCSITIRNTEIESHLVSETEKLSKLSGTKQKIHKNYNTSATNGSSETSNEVWEIFQKVKCNRNSRQKIKSRKRKSEEAICPICDKEILEDTNLHIDLCLKRANNGGDSDENIDVEGDYEVEEYEWAGQSRVRATSLLQGGVSTLGTSLSTTNEDEDLVVDGDDTNMFGLPQYSEHDIIIPSDDKEHVALRKAVIGSDCGNSVAKTKDNEVNVNIGGDPILEALKSRIRELETRELTREVYKCLICMERYKTPVISVCCWHVHCEQCWLQTLGAKKLCPQCNMITSPSDLRRIYM